MGALLFVFVEAICLQAFLRFIIFLTVVLNIKQPVFVMFDLPILLQAARTCTCTIDSSLVVKSSSK